MSVEETNKQHLTASATATSRAQHQPQTPTACYFAEERCATTKTIWRLRPIWEVTKIPLNALTLWTTRPNLTTDHESHLEQGQRQLRVLLVQSLVNTFSSLLYCINH
jgi:hypothetical protein